MREMFAQFFRMITLAFSAGEKLAGAADEISGYLNESAGAFADQARMERQEKMAQLMAQAKPVKQIESAKPARVRKLTSPA
jgi:uncharacterized protein YjbJ (UPF0337 family)